MNFLPPLVPKQVDRKLLHANLHEASTPLN